MPDYPERGPTVDLDPVEAGLVNEEELAEMREQPRRTATVARVGGMGDPWELTMEGPEEERVAGQYSERVFSAGECPETLYDSGPEIEQLIRDGYLNEPIPLSEQVRTGAITIHYDPGQSPRDALADQIAELEREAAKVIGLETDLAVRRYVESVSHRVEWTAERVQSWEALSMPGASHLKAEAPNWKELAVKLKGLELRVVRSPP